LTKTGKSVGAWVVEWSIDLALDDLPGEVGIYRFTVTLVSAYTCGSLASCGVRTYWGCGNLWTPVTPWRGKEKLKKKTKKKADKRRREKIFAMAQVDKHKGEVWYSRSEFLGSIKAESDASGRDSRSSVLTSTFSLLSVRAVS
jgi:hypothetical protein